ncbi:ABC transporter permease [Aureimonas altamirensis]|uniref:ABC transporter permease n=1 Tax=Aureimonas altamirensis TaxID=370622 RepID=A0A0B1QAC7_9HYPH|nr:ABC transporter permease [Aureimonas altamirensis]KHJ56331.1 ABC transporter permease [Aureimonas altamirensis]
MIGYVFWRILQMIPVLLGITLIVFLLLRVSGDPVSLMLGEDATQGQIAQLREAYGLDQPLYTQYLRYMGDLLTGNFGQSIRYNNQPALDVVLERLPATASLAGTALVFAIVISLPAGIIAALYRGRLPDHVASFLSVLGQAMPNFWLGIMLILFFAIGIGWFPVSGREHPFAVVLPGLALGASLAAVLTRLLRSSLIEVMSQDYIRTARAKGLTPTVVIIRHGMRNAILSYLTVVGLEASSLMAGAVVTEQVFAWPGIGLLAIQAINSRDMAVVQTIVILAAVIVMVVNLLVDVLYSLVDPRIQHG